MNKGPVFNAIKKYIKSEDKAWRAPRNIKKENCFVFLKIDSETVPIYSDEKEEESAPRSLLEARSEDLYLHQISPRKVKGNRKKTSGKEMIKVSYYPERNEYRVSHYQFNYSLTQGEKNWKGSYEKETSVHIKFDKRGLPVCYRNEKKTIWNHTYKPTSDRFLIENVFLIANGLPYDSTGITPYVNPVLADLPKECTRSKYFKAKDLADLFDQFSVRGKTLRKWVLSKGYLVISKCVLLKALSKVDVNVLQTHLDALERHIFGCKTGAIKVFGRFNDTLKFKRLMKALSKDTGAREFYDLARLENEYRLHVKGRKPIAENIRQYHNALKLAIVKAKDAEALVPYTKYKEELELEKIEKVNGYLIKLPTCPYDLMVWGDRQGHCIGSYPRKKNMILLSLWKDTEIISCMELRYQEAPKNGIVDPYTKRYMEWKIIQHYGHENHDPKMSPEDKLAVESAILNCLNQNTEEKVENEKVLR